MNNKGRGNSRWQPKPSPVRAEVSSGGSAANASGEKPHGSGKAVGHTSGGSTYINETPAGRRGGGWSSYGSGSSSRGDSPRQWTKSSEANNASDSHRDERSRLKSGNSSSGEKDVNKLSSESSPVVNGSYMESLCLNAAPSLGKSLPVKSCSDAKTPESTASIRENENSEIPIVKFDLCPPRKSSASMKPSLYAQNREKRKESERTMGGAKGVILRPGMVLLKNYLSTSEQGSILNICRHHGLETVGFENPSFGEGGKMHLKLMCYGMSWDPKTNEYGDVRSIDKVKPPPIHRKLLELVDRAVKDSQSLISENPKVKNVESILPSVKPDICLVNYYSNTGRLGLHQDKDESRESLSKGIPIVSFSIGDSAEFLYSDQREVESADKVILESGDVLIFGGQSRHIFHGVPTILKDTAPKTLIGETNFRSGRLNLTFRQRF